VVVVGQVLLGRAVDLEVSIVEELREARVVEQASRALPSLDLLQVVEHRLVGGEPCLLGLVGLLLELTLLLLQLVRKLGVDAYLLELG
jgi:hypothetical protein